MAPIEKIEIMLTRRSNRARPVAKRLGRPRNRKNAARQAISSALSGPKPFQKQVQMIIPGINRSIVSLSLAPTAYNQVLDPTLDVVNWASYAKVYDEFRVLSIQVVISPVAIVSGLTMFYMDEDDSTLPTNVTAVTHASNVYSNDTVCAPVFRWKKYQMHGYNMQWTPAALEDMDWHDTSAAWAHVYLKAYTDNSFYSTPDETHLYVVRAFYTLSFRGTQ